MSKNFSIDYNDLDTSINKKAYLLKDVQNKIVKVAFDVVKFLDDDAGKLWKIENSADGDYIVALYNDEDTAQVKTASADKSNWEVVIQVPQKNVHFLYKGSAIANKSFASLGFPVVDDLPNFKKSLLNVLATNSKFVSEIFKEAFKGADEEMKKSLYSKYPELNNGSK